MAGKLRARGKQESGTGSQSLKFSVLVVFKAQMPPISSASLRLNDQGDFICFDDIFEVSCKMRRCDYANDCWRSFH